MRFQLIAVLVVAGLTMTSSAQKLQKPKAKPAYSAERENVKKPGHVGKEPTHTSAAQELRRVEQSSAKVSRARKVEGAKTPHIKTPKNEGNPPIHFASSGGSGKGSGKTGDALKGRLRHKGRR